MSTILKALRRLEEEKVVVPGDRPLREQVAATTPASAAAAPRRFWVPVLALLAGLGVGVSAFWVLVYHPTAAPAVAAAAPTPPPPAESTGPQPAQPVRRVAPTATAPPPGETDGPPEQAFASNVAVVPRPDAKLRLEDAEPVRPSTAAKPGANRPVESSSAVARARARALERRAQQAVERAKAQAAAVSPTPTPPTPAPVKPAPAEPPTRRVAVAPKPPAEAPPAPQPKPPEAKPQPTPPRVAAAPAASEAPVEPSEPTPSEAPAPGDDLPTAAPSLEIDVVVERTQWHPLPDRRSAWLEIDGTSRKVVEGDVVSGILVSEIQPSGVIFERDGQTLRRPLGTN